MAKSTSTFLLPTTVIALVLGALGIYWYMHREMPIVIATKAEAPIASVQETVHAYLAAHHSLLAGRVTVGSPVVNGNYARVSITPFDPAAGDAAVGFLHKQGSRWEVIAIGTVFEPEFYAQHSIPRSLQL